MAPEHEPIEVLLVEDDPEWALLVRHHLDEGARSVLRFELRTARSLAEGVAQLSACARPVILLDLNLPDSAGLATLGALRARAPGAPIVVLTNLDHEELSLQAVADGAQDFLIKERLEPWQLRRALGYAVERRRQSDDIARLERLRADARGRQQVEWMKDRLLSKVSHQFRTPITIVAAALSNVLEGLAGPLTRDQSEQLGMAQRGIHRLARMIDDFVELSRLESGQAAPALSDVSLTACAHAAAAEARPARPEVSIEVRSADAAFALADRELVLRLLRHLLDNACRFSRGRVHVEAWTAGEEAVLRVVDDGPGVPSDKAGRIFERFAPLDDPAREPGLGLGLAVVQQIVRLHGGRLWLEPGAEPGARFGVALPAARTAAVAS